MKKTLEQIKVRLAMEAERMKKQEWHGTIWRPTIAPQELAERKQKVDRGELPF